MHARLAALIALSLPLALAAGEFAGVQDLAARRAPWLSNRIRFEKLESDKDVFELRSQPDGVEIRASGPSAAAMGLGWYLKYYCHRSMSHVGDNLGPVPSLPVIDQPVRIEAWARTRYALNYCTFNYTMSFYSWADWEHELDWMALSGVNLMLVANGEEAVWQRTLRRLGFSEDEIAGFIPGPAYTAWWLMGNLEGVGGPMSGGMIGRRSDLQRRIIARMRSMGIEPVLPGFYGMVPSSLSGKVSAHIVDQGKWSSFHRPSILDPTDPEFSRIAGIYYDELGKLYGTDLHYFSGDPFHEGGVTAGVDLSRAGSAIQAAMQAHFPGSTWVLQGWLDNPRRELIAATDRTHVLIQELQGEQTHNWELRRGYEGTPFLWCCINNFGERPGIFGKLQRYADETYRARTGEFGRYLRGVGIMPEGIANNPVAYDLALELGWRRDHVDASRWLQDYLQYRYGGPDPDIAAAWDLLLKTAYGGESGAPEIVLCAKPASPAAHVSTWGSLKIGYDPAEFARAVELFARARDRFRGIETYRLDLIALQVQAASNEALGISGRVDAALRQGNRDAFENASNAFLGLGREIDGRLDADPFYRLQTYRDQAIRYGTTPAERQSCLRNALTLVTYWGGSGTQANEDNDYAFKAWSGLMTSYYLKRWESYFQFIRASWDNPGAPRPDFYSWERDWVDRNSSGPVP
jgi:alpha-N-acetylglucosaminidase